MELDYSMVLSILLIHFGNEELSWDQIAAEFDRICRASLDWERLKLLTCAHVVGRSNYNFDDEKVKGILTNLYHSSEIYEFREIMIQEGTYSSGEK